MHAQQLALSPHAMHVHPLHPEGSTHIVWTWGSPIHSNGSFVATVGGTVRLGGMETGISEASKRVSIFSFATQRPNGNWQGLEGKQACKVSINGVSISP